MSLILHSCAGRVHIVKTDQGSKEGWFKFNPDISVGSEAKILYQSAPTKYSEIIQPTVTLDDSNFMVVFGSGWVASSVAVTLLLGDASSGGGAVNALIDWYKQNRVGALREAIEFSVADRGYEVFLTGLSVGAVDPVYHRLTANIEVHMLDI